MNSRKYHTSSFYGFIITRGINDLKRNPTKAKNDLATWQIAQFGEHVLVPAGGASFIN